MSARFRHGLVIGKFYPPHVGHDHLVAAAAARCERVTVVVAGSSQESLTVQQRVEWLSATHAGTPHVRVVGDLDDHPMDYGDQAVWDAHVAVFAAGVARAAIEDGLDGDGAVVDAVFSSERYGEELARRFGAAPWPTCGGSPSSAGRTPTSSVTRCAGRRRPQASPARSPSTT